jgi:GGDEF domain-containing protein
VAEKIITALRTPMRPGDAIVVVSTSIGIAWADTEPVGGPALVERADTALYRAKARGKNTYQFAGEAQARRAGTG